MGANHGRASQDSIPLILKTRTENFNINAQNS